MSRFQPFFLIFPIIPLPSLHVIVLTLKTIFAIPILQRGFYLKKKNANQKKEESISDLLVMARPERVAFGLSLASSSSKLLNARMTSLESSAPPESMVLPSYSSLSLSSVLLLSTLAILSFCVNVLAFLSVG